MLSLEKNVSVCSECDETTFTLTGYNEEGGIETYCMPCIKKSTEPVTPNEALSHEIS